MSGRTPLALGWTLAVLVACTIPGTYVPDAPVVSFDKAVHVALFAVWTVLWLRAAPHRVGRIVAGAVAFAVFIEVWQAALPIGRSGEVADALADGLGLGLGLLGWWAWRRSNSRVPRGS